MKENELEPREHVSAGRVVRLHLAVVAVILSVPLRNDGVIHISQGPNDADQPGSLGCVSCTLRLTKLPATATSIVEGTPKWVLSGSTTIHQVTHSIERYRKRCILCSAPSHSAGERLPLAQIVTGPCSRTIDGSLLERAHRKIRLWRSLLDRQDAPGERDRRNSILSFHNCKCLPTPARRATLYDHESNVSQAQCRLHRCVEHRALLVACRIDAVTALHSRVPLNRRHRSHPASPSWAVYVEASRTKGCFKEESAARTARPKRPASGVEPKDALALLRPTSRYVNRLFWPWSIVVISLPGDGAAAAIGNFPIFTRFITHAVPVTSAAEHDAVVTALIAGGRRSSRPVGHRQLRRARLHETAITDVVGSLSGTAVTFDGELPPRRRANKQKGGVRHDVACGPVLDR